MSAVRVGDRRGLVRFGVGAALLSCGMLSTAQTSGDPSAWLTRIHQAAINRSYQGTMAFSAGGHVSSSRVVHIADGRERYERIEVLAREIRHRRERRIRDHLR